MCDYNIETRVPRVSHTTKARHIRSNVIVFLDSDGVIHYEFLSLGSTLNKEHYLKILRHLREVIRKNVIIVE